MKKLLSMLGAIGLVATSSASVVACGSKAGDSDASGPSSDDVAKWDAMEIHDFEKDKFESTISNMLEAMDADNEFDAKMDQLADIMNDKASPESWTAQDTKEFEVLFNRVWSKENYDLLNYGVDRIKTEDKGYKLLPGYDANNPENSDLSIIQKLLNNLENDKCPVKDIESFSKWDELIKKAS